MSGVAMIAFKEVCNCVSPCNTFVQMKVSLGTSRITLKEGIQIKWGNDVRQCKWGIASDVVVLRLSSHSFLICLACLWWRGEHWVLPILKTIWRDHSVLLFPSYLHVLTKYHYRIKCSDVPRNRRVSGW